GERVAAVRPDEQGRGAAQRTVPRGDGGEAVLGGGRGPGGEGLAVGDRRLGLSRGLAQEERAAGAGRGSAAGDTRGAVRPASVRGPRPPRGADLAGTPPAHRPQASTQG